MPENIMIIKGKVVIEGKISESDQELLIKKYKSKKVFEIWRAQLKNLSFMTKLPKIESLSLINTKVDDLQDVSKINTLKKLFLNEFKPKSGWSFLSTLAQIEDIHILNIRGELIIPDLQKLEKLKAFKIWGCKGFADISSIKNAPNLQEVEFIDSGLSPESLIPLIEIPSIKHIAASFKTEKENRLFQSYLQENGKQSF